MNFIQYVKQLWKNGPGGGTPWSAARLNHMEDGIKANNDMISELNSNSITLIDSDVSDWNNIKRIGWYSGNNALNAPTTGWVNVIVLADNNNRHYLEAIAFSKGLLYRRKMTGDVWADEWAKLI